MKGYYFYIAVATAILLYFGGRYLYFKPQYTQGEIAPDFSGQLIDGSDFSLNELRGHYVLLDFWGSWCGPCRRENPEISRLFEKYRPKSIPGSDGFVVVSVGIEMNEVSWKKAIVSDKLDWRFHIGQFNRFDSPIPKAYGVREIPTKYLIGPDGQIIKANPTIAEVDEILSKAG